MRVAHKKVLQRVRLLVDMPTTPLPPLCWARYVLVGMHFT